MGGTMGLMMAAFFTMFSPADVARHLAAPPTQAAPLFVEVGGAGHWVGVSWRGGAPGRWAQGSAALYYNGPEDAPEADFVREVAQGREAALSGRLLELRWFDEDGRLVRRIDRARLRALGFGEDARDRVLPPPQAEGTLWF